jgi:hypothetical protein
MLVDCSCGTTNRIPGASAKRHRCGKCKHVFTPQELTKARIEPPPPKPEGDLLSAMLSQMADAFGDGVDSIEFDGGPTFDMRPHRKGGK